MAVDRSKRILVVDDDESILLALRRVLGRSAKVELARTPDEALKMLQASRFDIVVCDYGLGERDGLWLLERIRAQSPDTLRVMLSGRSPELFEEHRDRLIQRYLAKPVEVDELLTALGLVRMRPDDART